MSRGILAVASLLVASGCAAHEPEVAPAVDAEHLCSVRIARTGLPESFEGAGEAGTADAARAAAWAAACARVPAAQRRDCHPSGAFTVASESTSVQVSVHDGETTQVHRVALTLVEASAGATGERRSTRGQDDACDQARAAACAAVGAPGRCTDGGTYRVQWEHRGPRPPFP